MEFNDLMRALAENSNVEGGFPADEDGVVCVGNGNLRLSFMEVPESRSLLVWSSVGALPEDGADALKTEMLKANFMGRDVNGGALSLSDDGDAYLHRILQFDLLDKAAFLKAIENFILVLSQWAHTIAEFRPETPETPEEPRQAAFDEADLSGFIRA